EKHLPLPRTITTSTSRFAARRPAQAIISRISCADMALRASGRFSVTVATALLISRFRVRYMCITPCFYVELRASMLYFPIIQQLHWGPWHGGRTHLFDSEARRGRKKCDRADSRALRGRRTENHRRAHDASVARAGRGLLRGAPRAAVLQGPGGFHDFRAGAGAGAAG